MPEKKEVPKKEKKEHVELKVSHKSLIYAGIAVAAVVLILVLFVFKLHTYTKTEMVTETRERDKIVTETMDDLTQPYTEVVCGDVEAKYRVEVDQFSPYMRPFGLSEHKCYAEAKIWNDGKVEGKWTLRYIFYVNEIAVKTEPVVKTVFPLNPTPLKFETDQCQEGDTLTGELVVLQSPTVEVCENVVSYKQKTVEKTVVEEYTVDVERTSEHEETLFQWMTGKNQ